ncbi:MAG: lytic transglycosylase domain-containing protein [Bacteroidetes bacterium]|nr:MAG: lytic transglycosylase domain-containing protein [Bacteroidota bacterium]
MKRSYYLGVLMGLIGLAIYPVGLNSPGSVEPLSAGKLEKEWAESCQKIIQDATLQEEGWDTLAQTRFWRLVMQLDPGISLINIARTREVVGTVDTDLFDSWKKKRQEAFKDSVRSSLGLPEDAEIYITSGKNHFYSFDKVVPSISKGIEVFAQEGVDPWYAQSILLIESPGKLQLSTAGAYGPFQLMKGVAKEQGLTVNKDQDDRKDFVKSARGAARLIRRVCLPKTRAMLEELDLSYQETDIWFRLLVLHVYHAGARNVRGALRKIRPKEGGMELIRQLWQTQYRRFGNASQNYSQIALASMLELHDLALEKPGSICPMQDAGDR